MKLLLGLYFQKNNNNLIQDFLDQAGQIQKFINHISLNAMNITTKTGQNFDTTKL